MRRKTFALPDWGGTVWSWLLPAGIVGTFVLIDQYVPPFAFSDIVLGIFAFPVLVLGYSTVALFIAWCVQKHRESEYAQAARKLGLRFSIRVTEEQLAPYSSHLLFASTANFRRYAGYRIEGEVNGCQVQVFVYRYSGKARLANGRHLRWVGYHSVFLASLPGVPDFLLTPEAGEYELTDVVAGWLRGVERNEVALDVKVGQWTMVLRGKDEAALRQLFSARNREAMGLWWGWWAECLDGKLLLYTERAVVESDGLSGALQAWVSFANGLSKAACSLPAARASWQARDPRLRHGPPDHADDPRLRPDPA